MKIICPFTIFLILPIMSCHIQRSDLMPSEIIHNYLITENKFTVKMANENIEKFQRHSDIMEEFANWIINRAFVNETISVEGYTAEYLYTSTFLTVLGSYNYLIYLREEPCEALKYLTEGFPIE